MRKLSLLACIFLLLFQACKKDVPDAIPIPASGIRYVPYSKGMFVVYRADSLVWNDFTGRVDTFRFYIKEKVSGAFADAANQSTRIDLEYYRSASADSFVVPRIWSALISKSYFVKTEENIPRVKLSFPLSPSKIWNGNASNTLGEQPYACMQLHTPANLGVLTFDSTAWVLQKADSNLITMTYQREIYSTACGLCYSQELKLEDTRSTLDITRPLRLRANKGYNFTRTAILYGKE